MDGPPPQPLLQRHFNQVDENPGDPVVHEILPEIDKEKKESHYRELIRVGKALTPLYFYVNTYQGDDIKKMKTLRNKIAGQNFLILFHDGHIELAKYVTNQNKDGNYISYTIYYSSDPRGISNVRFVDIRTIAKIVNYKDSDHVVAKLTLSRIGDKKLYRDMTETIASFLFKKSKKKSTKKSTKKSKKKSTKKSKKKSTKTRKHRK